MTQLLCSVTSPGLVTISSLVISLAMSLVACSPTATPSQVEPISKEPILEKPIPEVPIVGTPAPSSSTDLSSPAANLDDGTCDGNGTQLEMNICARRDYEQVDAQLNQAYQALQQDLPTGGQQALTLAELAWIEFRDRDCTFEKSQFSGGSIESLIYNSCLTAHTEARITELQQALLPETSYQAADAQLNETYQTLLSVLGESDVDEVTDVQIAWIDYRDRNCTFEILHGADVIEESQCLARMSETRIAQLEDDIVQRSL